MTLERLKKAACSLAAESDREDGRRLQRSHWDVWTTPRSIRQSAHPLIDYFSARSDSRRTPLFARRAVMMLTIIGCGNANRCDDGVGVQVVQELRRQLANRPSRSDVRVFDAGTAGFEVMFQARGTAKLVLVDACVSGSSPGAVFEVPGGELEVAPQAGSNLHNFRWDHALHAGRRIFANAFPKDVTVILIEAKELGLGLELSPPVAAASKHVLGRLEQIVAEYGNEGATANREVTLQGGSIHLDAEVYEAYFRGIETVAVLLGDEDLCILPIRAGAGLLVKRRNARGDRIVHAMELLRPRGLDGPEKLRLTVKWDSQRAALVAHLTPPATPDAT
jgi:hydrogenase maturation protease